MAAVLHVGRACSFCGKGVASGKGIMYVRNDGSILWFCSSKCRKNQMNLGRDPRKKKWTLKYTKGGRR